MKSFFRVAVLAVVFLFALSATACGRGQESDGIDSITPLSEYKSYDSFPEQSSETGQSSENQTAFQDVLGKELAIYKEYAFSSSLYLLFLNSALDSVAESYQISVSDALSVEVLLQDGSIISCPDYCRKYADNEFRWACLLYTFCKDAGHSVENCPSYTDAAQHANAVYRSNVPFYSALKISLDDLVLYYLYQDLYEDLFTILYSPGGPSQISYDALSAMMEQDMRKIRYTYLPFYDDETQARLSDEEIDRYTEISLSYIDRYEKGESFADIVRENYIFLDTYNFSIDPNNVDVYYSVFSPNLPSSIVECAEEMEMYEVRFLLEEDFTSVVQRMPVNETLDANWLANALRLARDSEYGAIYETMMEEEFDSFQLQIDQKKHDLLTVENLILFLDDQAAADSK